MVNGQAIVGDWNLLILAARFSYHGESSVLDLPLTTDKREGPILWERHSHSPIDLGCAVTVWMHVVSPECKIIILSLAHLGFAVVSDVTRKRHYDLHLL